MKDVGPHISSLAIAESTLARAGAVLMEAEARLAEAAQAQAHADPATSNDVIDVCRETCRRARQEWRLALYRRDRHALVMGQPIDALSAEESGIRITRPGARPGAVPGVPRPSRDEANRSMLSGARARSHGSDPQAGESARHEEVSAGAPVPGRPFPDPALRHGRLLLARHAAALLALVLAYLQYNFFEVHLVIESLPSIVVYLPPW